MMNWMQEFGAVLIVVAVMLMWMSKSKKSRRSRKRAERRLWAAFVVLLGVGLIDLLLIGNGEQTITQFVNSVFGRWTGVTMMVFLILHTGLVFGIRGFITVLLGTIWGHLWF